MPTVVDATAGDTTRVAAVDCGTNSIRLLISDVDAAGKADLLRELRIVRLGEGVDRTGRLDDDALRRTFEACDAYAATVLEYGAVVVRFCATSATRDARNADVFAEGVRQRFGVTPDVLSGDAEAALSFVGATRDLTGVVDPLLVLDLGGGSTELVLGRDGHVEQAESLDVGSVRMTERHLRSDPPTGTEVADCAADVDAALDACSVDLEAARSVVGVAGSVTTVAAHALDLRAYDGEALQHARIPLDDLRSSCAAILAASVAERRAMPFMHPRRADVIGAGALILARVVDRLDAATSELVVSESDILDGIAWSLA